MMTEEEIELIRSFDINERVIGIRQFVKRHETCMPIRKQVMVYVPTNAFCEMLKYWIANNEIEHHFDIQPFDSTTDDEQYLEFLFVIASLSVASARYRLSFMNLKDDAVEMLLATSHHETESHFIAGVCVHLDECKNLSRRIHLLLVHHPGHNFELKRQLGRTYPMLGEYDKKLLSGEETMSLSKYAYYMIRRLNIIDTISTIKSQISDYRFIMRNSQA